MKKLLIAIAVLGSINTSYAQRNTASYASNPFGIAPAYVTQSNELVRAQPSIKVERNIPKAPVAPTSDIMNNTSASVVPNQYIVKFHSELCNGGSEVSFIKSSRKSNIIPAPLNCEDFANQIVSNLGGVIHHHYKNVFFGYAASLSPEALEVIRTHPFTEKVGVDSLMKLHDSGIQKLPGVPATKQLMQIASTPEVEVGTYRFPASGKGVRAYVIDSGIKPHIDYRGRLLEAEGIDLVRDGFGTRDCFPHGTPVAGIIAGNRVGVAKDTLLVPIRVSGCAQSDGSPPVFPISRTISAIEFILKQNIKPSIINMSLGGEDISNFLLDSVNVAISKGYTVVASAGNDGRTTSNNIFPQPNNGIIIVGALGIGDEKASFSDFGSDVVYAPGLDVTTTVRDQLRPLDFNGENKDFHNGLNGTSFAAPFVSGIAAILLEKFPNATPAQIKQMIWDAARTDVVVNIPIVVPLKPLGDAVNTNNLWAKSFAIKSITGRTTTSGKLDLYWRPFAKIELKITSSDASNWLGQVEIIGKFNNGGDVKCIVKGLLPQEAMSCEVNGTAIKKWTSKTARFEVTSINGKKVTYDRSQNTVTSIDVKF